MSQTEPRGGSRGCMGSLEWGDPTLENEPTALRGSGGIDGVSRSPRSERRRPPPSNGAWSEVRCSPGNACGRAGDMGAPARVQRQRNPGTVHAPSNPSKQAQQKHHAEEPPAPPWGDEEAEATVHGLRATGSSRPFGSGTRRPGCALALGPHQGGSRGPG